MITFYSDSVNAEFELYHDERNGRGCTIYDEDPPVPYLSGTEIYVGNEADYHK